MKLFKAIKDHIENDRKKRKIKCVGKNVSLGENAFILGERYIKMGNNFSAFANLRIEAIMVS